MSQTNQRCRRHKRESQNGERAFKFNQQTTSAVANLVRHENVDEKIELSAATNRDCVIDGDGHNNESVLLSTITYRRTRDVVNESVGRPAADSPLINVSLSSCTSSTHALTRVAYMKYCSQISCCNHPDVTQRCYHLSSSSQFFFRCDDR